MLQPPDDDDRIMLSFFCKDPESADNLDCPAFYRTDRGTWAVQGGRRDEKHVRAQLRGLKDWEGAVEIPDALAELFVIEFVKERYGIALGGRAEHADSQLPRPPEAGAA
jgi:hypothetical protein